MDDRILRRIQARARRELVGVPRRCYLDALRCIVGDEVVAMYGAGEFFVAVWQGREGPVIRVYNREPRSDRVPS